MFGLFFLAVVGNWAVWKQDLLTTRQLSLLTSGVLIFLGLVGVAATLWRSRPATAAPTPNHETIDEPTPEGPQDEEAHSQS
ncbi:hypothetical protein [Aeromicrobium sp. A1-2]|uniref:hypothetical protein n=1 Tax=Aeromicrobium sp. A1-2 TaxID=2107713 RepID=UPI0013C2A337|nr:hypothetical protein [Aeromicrobium sp. A1-2]